VGSVKKTLDDLLRDVGYFDVYDESVGGNVIGSYIVDDIEYVQVVFPNSPGVIYTYIKGD
jgi:hypothetical protein